MGHHDLKTTLGYPHVSKVTLERYQTHLTNLNWTQNDLMSSSPGLLGATLHRQSENYDKPKPYWRIKKVKQSANYDRTFVYLGVSGNFRQTMQVASTKELSPYIKHYLFLEGAGDSIKKLRLFSDGNTGMVLTFKGNLISNFYDNKVLNYPNSFLYGQISEFKDLYLAGKTAIIIVVFQPFGINHLLGISANELRDGIIATEDIFGNQSALLHEKMSEQPLLATKVQILNAFFNELTTKKAFSNQTIIHSTLNYILKNKGAVTVNHLVKYTGYTERHIERIFNESIGLNPKKFGNIVKLHFFLNLLKYKSNQSNITDLCYEAGYADQSHLIKEFKKYTGITPTQYLNHTSRLAINFMEIKSDALQMSGLYNL
jgi:AraC-like DNA-binding protein